MALHQSLSVVLSVHNGEKTLHEKVEKLLDMLPDMTPRFEIVVIDNGSEDQTSEVALELARKYPQVQCVPVADRLGWYAIVEMALARTWGEVVFVQEGSAPIDSSKFQRLWALRDKASLALPLNRFGAQPSIMKRVAAWGLRLDNVGQNGQRDGLQMIRRGPKAATIRSTELLSQQASRLTRSDRAQPIGKLVSHELDLPAVHPGAVAP